MHFTLEVSGGKDPKTNEWRKPIYADCTAFGELHIFIFDLSYSMQISWYFSGYMKGEDHGNTRI